MTDPDDADTASSAAAAASDTAAAASEEAARRRRLAEVFGDVLPEGSSDEPTPTGRDDRWYEENRPPHHGG
ncbi:hypothetical protein F4560_007280 [Saccharothrix ecbatanensis]|uniref:Uncharacterized protein n=1 Tax=Saccharothrix ecbatanensis TaxID=1105145 RepID=A0A7W9HS65_9PSEU|nr:hypothetical protein [Saccharothrix ecbatanensis]MBB5807512.1 hypothetical protein [Saccharothrix ecbatanensis]